MRVWHYVCVSPFTRLQDIVVGTTELQMMHDDGVLHHQTGKITHSLPQSLYYSICMPLLVRAPLIGLGNPISQVGSSCLITMLFVCLLYSCHKRMYCILRLLAILHMYCIFCSTTWKNLVDINPCCLVFGATRTEVSHRLLSHVP